MPPPKDDHLLRYPPFPVVPPGVSVIPFSEFRENGIRIFGLPFGIESLDAQDEDTTGVEVDGLGIPTVALRVPHGTDECKTETRRKGQSEAAIKKKEEKEKEKEAKKQKEKEDKERRKDKDMLKNMDPIERAMELRRRRILLFAKKEWYDQWKEGEDLRGKKVYDPNMSIIDRIHTASTEFRTSRPWPPATTRLGYLWDQFRLFAGLLGSPPIWYRTDLQQGPDDVLDDAGDYDEGDAQPREQAAAKAKAEPRKASAISDDDFSDDDVDSDDQKQTSIPQHLLQEDPTRQKRKRIPARTPYALHNFEPIPVSSDSQVNALLRLASLRKHSKLLAFLSNPDTSIAVFLSWYARKEGLIWSISHLIALPRLVLFFLEFLIRVKALPESERALKRAADIARLGVHQVPNSGRLCRHLPDKVDAGMRNLWGVRWVEEPFKFSANDERTEGEEKAAAMKFFEEELKATNVKVVPAEEMSLPPLKFDNEHDKEERESSVGTPIIPTSDISIQVMSPTSPVPATPGSPIAGIELPIHDEADPKMPSLEEILPPTPPLPSATTQAEAFASVPTGEPIPSRWNVDPPLTPLAAAQEQKALLEAWEPPCVQPLVDILGMTVFPLKYEAGIAERSMRRVKAVVAPGEKLSTVKPRYGERDLAMDAENRKKLEAWMERRFRGVQEELVGRLSRVVLEPWTDWDDGGCTDEYATPKIQGASREDGQIEHDPKKDMIVVLMEPRIAEQISVGMGLAGTWVQIVRKRSASHGGSSRGGRGGYRGRGRGGGRTGHHDGAGVTSASSEGHNDPSNVDENVASPQDTSPTATVSPESHKPSGSASSHRGNGGGRGGYNRGRGGYSNGGAHFQPEFTFWYVEEVYMAVPSFWTVGEEDEPLVLPQHEDLDDDDFDDELED